MRPSFITQLRTLAALVSRSRRFQLWVVLAALISMVVGLLVFLTGRYEEAQWRARAESDAVDANYEVRRALSRHEQHMQAQQSQNLTSEARQNGSLAWLVSRRELRALEWRDARMNILTRHTSPFAPSTFDARRDARERAGPPTEAGLACSSAVRYGEPAYSPSYFFPEADGLGAELLELCSPILDKGRVVGYQLAVIALRELLEEHVSQGLKRGQVIALTEADGSRLASVGLPTKASMRFSGSRLLDLPGHTFVLRVERGYEASGSVPNLMVTWVTLLSIALLVVLALLFIDMQRRQSAEAQLAQALAFRKAMEDSLSTGLRARDRQGRITYVNPAFCQMVGYESTELVGSSSPAPYWPSERAAEYEARQNERFAHVAAPEKFPQGKPAREGFESEFIRRDGERFPVLIMEAPLLDAKGSHLGWMSAVIDISEKRRAEVALRQREDRLQTASKLATVGEMASLISHELNQPLAAISSYSEGAINVIATKACSVAGDDQNGPDFETDLVRQALQRIAAQAARAGRVIRSVHDFVKHQEDHRESVAAQSLLDGALPLIQMQAHQTRTELKLGCEVGIPKIACNRTLVEQVLLNLSRNAMQAMTAVASARRELNIEVRARDRLWAEFHVADTGPGIDNELREHVFTEFFTTKADGLGLGLSLCRSVIEQHGGVLELEAVQPTGTRFIFTLPFITDPDCANHSSDES